MKVRIEFYEHSRRECVIEAESVEEVRENWALGYDSGMVDEIEAQAVEIDGGIDWASATIEAAR